MSASFDGHARLQPYRSSSDPTRRCGYSCSLSDPMPVRSTSNPVQVIMCSKSSSLYTDPGPAISCAIDVLPLHHSIGLFSITRLILIMIYRCFKQLLIVLEKALNSARITANIRYELRRAIDKPPTPTRTRDRGMLSLDRDTGIISCTHPNSRSIVRRVEPFSFGSGLWRYRTGRFESDLDKPDRLFLDLFNKCPKMPVLLH